MKIAVLAGDGIGPEITAEAMKILSAIADRFNHKFDTTDLPIGWAAIDDHGQALPEFVHEECLKSDAIFLAAIGLPDRDESLPPAQRPERAALLPLRVGNFANLRPIWMPDCMACDQHPSLDMLIVRELNSGIYMGGDRGRREVDGVIEAYDTMSYSVPEVEQIAHVAFHAAMNRSKDICSVDKANILESSVLWRETIIRIARQYPEVSLRHQLVDSAAPALVKNANDFDVMVTGNIFGDILSDLGAVLAGSLGMLPSASIGGKASLFEPAHGSAPDIMGKQLANPIASILSVGMMMTYAFDLLEEGQAVKSAVLQVLGQGYRTIDIMQDGCRQVGTSEFGDLVTAALLKT